MFLCMHCMQNYEEKYSNCPICGYLRGAPPDCEFHLYPETILYKKYIIGTVLGYGGFGITYRAFDANLEKVVAIKEFYPRDYVNRTPGEKPVNIYNANEIKGFIKGKEQFLEEARVIAQFNTHHNIVHVFDYFEENNTAYMVMEYLDGVDYKEYINSNKENNTMTLNTALKVTYAVSNALKKLHKANIIHRDLKPGNIYICNNGDIKLIDFGAARFSDNENEITRTVIYTSGYAPIEQYQKKSKQGEYTDVYALGAVLYYSLIGQKPSDAIDRVKNDLVLNPKVIDDSIPQHVNDAIMRAIALKPEFRFKNISEFELALKGEQNFRTVENEVVYRKKRKCIVSLSILILLFIASIFTYNLYKNEKLQVILNPATLEVWLPISNDSDKGMYNSMLSEFSEKNNQVTIDLVFINKSTYIYDIEQAFKEGRPPDLFYSSGINEEYEENFAVLDDIFKLISISNYWFLNKYDEYYPNHKKIPLTFNVTVNYQNILIDNSEVTKVYNSFINEPIKFFNGTICDYKAIQKDMAGKYIIKEMNAVDIDSQFTNEWSICKDSTKDEKAASFRLLYFLMSEKSMDVLTIQNSNQLPLNKEIFKSYIGVNIDFGYLSNVVGELNPSQKSIESDVR